MHKEKEVEGRGRDGNINGINRFESGVKSIENE